MLIGIRSDKTCKYAVQNFRYYQLHKTFCVKKVSYPFKLPIIIMDYCFFIETSQI